jgi:hypothetical protein
MFEKLVRLAARARETRGGGLTDVDEGAMMGCCDAACFQKLLQLLEAFAGHRLTSLNQRFSSNHFFKQR